MKKQFVRGERDCCDDDGNVYHGDKKKQITTRKGKKRTVYVCNVCEREVADYFMMARCGISL